MLKIKTTGKEAKVEFQCQKYVETQATVDFQSQNPWEKIGKNGVSVSKIIGNLEKVGEPSGEPSGNRLGTWRPVSLRPSPGNADFFNFLFIESKPLVNQQRWILSFKIYGKTSTGGFAPSGNRLGTVCGHPCGDPLVQSQPFRGPNFLLFLKFLKNYFIKNIGKQARVFSVRKNVENKQKWSLSLQNHWKKKKTKVESQPQNPLEKKSKSGLSISKWDWKNKQKWIRNLKKLGKFCKKMKLTIHLCFIFQWFLTLRLHFCFFFLWRLILSFHFCLFFHRFSTPRLHFCLLRRRGSQD